MAYKKTKRTPEPPKPEYVTATWQQVSGDVDRDATFIVTLPKREQRLHELWRLAFFHGYRHRAAVERKVLQLWPQRETILAQHPRHTLDEAISIIHGAI